MTKLAKREDRRPPSSLPFRGDLGKRAEKTYQSWTTAPSVNEQERWDGHNDIDDVLWDKGVSICFFWLELTGSPSR